MLKIICIGNQWRGADDGALFRALSRLGHLISIIDHTDFLPAVVNSFATKAINKITRGFFIRDYNQYLLRQFDIFKPDLVIVYKGPFVQSRTIERMKANGVPVINVFPDVSMFAHGPNIPKCMPLYDYIFTTKSFGIQDLSNA